VSVTVCTYRGREQATGNGVILALRPDDGCVPSGWAIPVFPGGHIRQALRKERPPPRGVSVFHAVTLPHGALLRGAGGTVAMG